MTYMGQFLQKEGSTTITGKGIGSDGRRDIGGPITKSAPGVTTKDHEQSCYCLRRLMRKLKKQSKMLCSGSTTTSRPTTFHCHYDPLSYARNFDRSGYDGAFGDDADIFYTFSSRFVAAPSSTSTPVSVLATSH